MLLLGASGAGKSDLLLRLLDHGFDLVADDRVDVVDGVARPPAALAGLLEVRGLGIVRIGHVPEARLALAVQLVPYQASAPEPSRLPHPARHAPTNLPLVTVDPATPSAPARIALALDCATGRVRQLAGAFA